MASRPSESQLELIRNDGETDQYPMARLVERIEGGSRHVQLLGASGPFAACALADLSRRLDRPMVVLTAKPKQAEALAEALRLFALAAHDPELEIDEEAGEGSGRIDDYVADFPEFDVGPFHGASPDRNLAMGRLTTLYRLGLERVPRFTVGSVRAAVRRTLPREAMAQYSRRLAFADELPNAELRDYLVSCGYTEVTIVEDPGTFAIRGDIVDIFSPFYDHPVRIERWGDEISEIRGFNAQTQRTIGELEEVHLFPVREEVLDDDRVSQARRRIRELGGELGVPSRAVATMVSDLEAGLHFLGIDALLPALYSQLEDILDYAPDDAVVVLVDPDAVAENVGNLLEKRYTERAAALADDQLTFGVEDYYRDLDATIAWAKARPLRVELRRVAVRGHEGEGFELPGEEDTFEFRARPNTDVVRLRKEHQGVEQTVAALVEELQAWKQRYGRICFACRTGGQAERLESLLKAHGEDPLVLDPPVDVSEPIPPPAGVLEIYRAELGEGFRSELLSLAVIAGSELFGSRVATQATTSMTEHVAISHFRDLTPGDHIVHVDFGIGLYHGLVHMELEGVGNDFLHLEYAGGDKLYLPVYRLGRVQKYIGAAESIRLDKLGGTGWEKTKERVKENIREIAGDLLKLYAQRELRKGHAFSPPDDLYHEFEAAFPYEETPDQARAIEQVLGDMVSEKPMDRLVCGDVGFGKTEVAIRAAMKAALDGFQVAVLVPTTILAEQHVISFRNRCEQFGVRVEGLSRFRSSKQTREILADTAQGKVDILIGTHRLLSQDVEYRKLGLLIVDEEQRFGVTHKEKIKQFKANVDVLTLTATPIPRTLQMSLLGIRDLSIIATPPHNRLAVRTHVARVNDAVIREAVMREIARGGQVFFVHNRVQTIGEIAEHLKKVVPEARIGVGHGQMPEHKLEEVMYSYIRGETNVLLCTSIIESGLDIPNANTIILDRADMFGLSQLYQLRGRVGRGKERAYAYLLIPARRKLNDDAEKRLEVIQTYTELGSGFQVATYDLEIRGAGNLLGDDQSGHVTAVGLDLYTELLEEAVHDMRGEELPDEFEPEVNVPLEAFLPEEYIPATSLRLMFYKRFSLCRSLDELYDTFGEMTDRFGAPPDPVRNLRDLIGIKVQMRAICGRRLDAGPAAISIDLDRKTPLRPELVIDWMEQTRGKARLTAEMRIIYKLKPDESAKPLQTARELLDKLLTMT